MTSQPQYRDDLRDREIMKRKRRKQFLKGKQGKAEERREKEEEKAKRRNEKR